MEGSGPGHRTKRGELVVPRNGTGAAAPTGTRRRGVLLAFAAVLALATAGGLAWRQIRPGDADPSEPRRTGIDLVIPTGPLPNEDGDWVRLTVRPAKGDAEVAVTGVTRAGRSAARDEDRFVVRFAPLGGDQDAAEVLVAQGFPVTIDGLWSQPPGWWQATIVGVRGDRSVAWLLVPDPNIDGPDALPTPPSSPEARTLYQRALANQGTMRSVRFWQTMADGAGVNAFSEHAVLAQGDAPPSFTYRALGGMEAVVIGERMWVRQPGEAWEQREAAPAIPPSRWAEEYEGATGFALGSTEDVGGVPCRVVTFVVPERTESPKRAAAWYAWWVGEESGQLRREAMVSRNHYMLNEFADIDAPLAIAPPTAPMGETPTPAPG
jgi:hypothetical protein